MSPYPLAKQRLPMLTIIKDAFNLVINNLLQLIILTSPFILVNFAFSLKMLNFENPETLNNPISYLLLLIYIPTSVMAVVRIHQLYLSGSTANSVLDVITFGRIEFNFIGWWIAIIFSLIAIIILPSILLGAMGAEFENQIFNEAITLSASLFSAYIVSRWILVLPACAIDDSLGKLKYSWQLTKGYALPVFFLLGLIPLFLQYLIQFVMISDAPLLNALISTLFLLVVAFQIALISLCYKWLTEQENNLLNSTFSNNTPDFQA